VGRFRKSLTAWAQKKRRHKNDDARFTGPVSIRLVGVAEIGSNAWEAYLSSKPLTFQKENNE
jgi:hypothetical protein